MRWTEEDLANFQRNSGRPLPKATQAEMAKNAKKAKQLAPPTEPPKPRKAAGPNGLADRSPPPPPARKYRNIKTTVDNIQFDSRLEAERYKQLKLLQAGGVVLYFLRQVPFHLPGGIRYVCDFMVVYTEEAHPQFEDCKGYENRVGINKIKQVEEIYAVQIQLLKKITGRRGRKGRGK